MSQSPYLRFPVQETLYSFLISLINLDVTSPVSYPTLEFVTARPRPPHISPERKFVPHLKQNIDETARMFEKSWSTCQKQGQSSPDRTCGRRRTAEETLRESVAVQQGHKSTSSARKMQQTVQRVLDVV